MLITEYIREWNTATYKGKQSLQNPFQHIYNTMQKQKEKEKFTESFLACTMQKQKKKDSE